MEAYQAQQAAMQAPSPAAAGGAGAGAGGGAGAAPAAARPIGPRKPTPLEMRCQKLQDLVGRAAAEIDGVQTWAERDGIVAPAEQQGSTSLLQTSGTSLLARVVKITKKILLREEPASGTSESGDPDLTFAMRQVLSVGQQIRALRASPVCGKRRATPEDDDDDESDMESGNETDADDFGNETETDEDDDETEVNGSAVGSLLQAEEGMDGAVKGFESNVHPHGNKWWRYRYEYTLVESLVFAFSVMLLYGVMWILHGVSFFGKFKFYNIGRTARLLRYVWGYIVFHAAATMIMVTTAYMLYMPWGEYNIVDFCAKAFHEMVDGRANVPFKGYSWLLMILNVQFQLFVCFGLYSFFILGVIRNFQRALDDWKALSDGDDDGVLPINVDLYKTFEEILAHRVEESESLQNCFAQAKLTWQGVDKLRQRGSGYYEFKTHLYFTDCFGKALEYLVEVSLKSNAVLAVLALFVAFLAHNFQVAFMYFMPLFIVMYLLIFGVGGYFGHKLRTGYKDHDHDEPLTWITLHSYCRGIQIILYCVFFSFSRLLLSNDIFMNYPKVYLAAVIALVVTLASTWFVSGEIMKETLCAIVLPPQIPEASFTKFLQLVACWHTTENCHECGVRQFPRNATLSRDWAGTKPQGAYEETPKDPAATPREERRLWSWR